MDLQFKSLPFEVKAASPDGSQFEGKASVFFNIDSYGEIVDDKAFDQDLPAFLENGFIGGLNHDWDHPIGKPMEGTKPMSDHLHVNATVVDTAHGMDVRKLLKAGVIRKLSIGYRVMGDMMLANEDECMAYWEQKGYKPNSMDMARCKGGARVLTRIQLLEASPVTVPANDLATITAVKAAQAAAEKAFAEARQAVETPEIPETPHEETPDRLTSIRSIAARAEAEDILRNAGFSRTESAAFISAVKALPRNAASDDADPAEDQKGEDALTAEADPLIPATDAMPDASETLTDGEKSGEGEAIVNPPAEERAEEMDPSTVEVRKVKDRLSRLVSQRQSELDAKLDLALMQIAGS